MEISRLDLGIIKSLLFKEGENKYNKIIKDLAADEAEEDIITIRLAAVDRNYNPITHKEVFVLDTENSTSEKKYFKYRKYISHSLLKNEVVYKESEFILVTNWDHLDLNFVEEEAEVTKSSIDDFLYSNNKQYKIFYSLEYLKANVPL